MYCTQCYESHEVVQQLVVTRGNAPEVLELVEEPFDEIALLVEVPVASVRSAAVVPGRSHRHGASFEYGVVEVLSIIGPIGDNGVAGKALDQGGCEQHLSTMTRTCNEADRVAEAVGSDMQFGT